MPADALIFDDDTHYAALMRELLSAQGFSVRYQPDGRQALELVRRERPALVLADVMMPGLDGISLCGSIKADPALAAATKVVVVSGKAYDEDRQRARAARADLFIAKPFDVAAFSEQMRVLLAGAPAAGRSPRAEPLRAVFRQEGAGPGCAALRLGSGLIVFDAGAGLAALAEETARDPSLREVLLLLTHAHAPHLAGLNGARAWPAAGIKLAAAGPREDGGALRRRLAAALGAAAARASFLDLGEGDHFALNGASLRALAARHPGPCLAYRVDTQRGAMVFAPDSELSPSWADEELTDYAEKLVAFCKGADLLVHDARFDESDAVEPAARGHASPRAAVALAARAGVRSLVLYHLDARYAAARRRAMFSAAQALSAEFMAGPEVRLAQDRLEASLG